MTRRGEVRAAFLTQLQALPGLVSVDDSVPSKFDDELELPRIQVVTYEERVIDRTLRGPGRRRLRVDVLSYVAGTETTVQTQLDAAAAQVEAAVPRVLGAGSDFLADLDTTTVEIDTSGSNGPRQRLDRGNAVGRVILRYFVEYT